MHVPCECGRAAIAPDLGRSQRISEMVGSLTSILPRHTDAEEAGCVQITVIVGRETCIAVPFGGAGGKLGLAESACTGAKLNLPISQVEGRWLEDRRIGLNPIAIGCEHVLSLLKRTRPA